MAQLAGIRTDNPLPPHNNDESLANHFADYFISKIDKIRKNFTGTPIFIPEAADIPTLLEVYSPYHRSSH